MEWLNSQIASQGQWAALLFALVAFGESTAFVGAIIPATPVLLLVGGLIGTGRLDPWLVLPPAIAGAIAGYAFSFWLGRKVGRRLGRFRWLRDHRRHAARARLFFRRYGAPSLIFGRFLLGPAQSMIPFAAGAAGMSRRRFWPINLLSGLLWVPICLLPGYLAARSTEYAIVDPAWQSAATNTMIAISAGAAAVCLLFVIARLVLSFARRAPSGR
jgi:membrane protein DedA with SNARE-associated domain